MQKVWALMLKIQKPANADHPNLHFNLGAALSDLQRYNEARDHINKALVIDSDRTERLRGLLSLLLLSLDQTTQIWEFL